MFETKAEAITAVRALQARGVSSIDVGCMQVNLMFHPNAFPTLEQAFDPPSNTLYAARFLSRLFAQTKDWTQATALYHSATPQLGEDYRRRVMALWPQENQTPPEAARDRLADAWAATLSGKPRPTRAATVRIGNLPASGSALLAGRDRRAGQNAAARRGGVILTTGQLHASN